MQRILLLVVCSVWLFFTASLALAEASAGVHKFPPQANAVRLDRNSFCDSAGPFLGLGASYFQALRDAKIDRPRLTRNLAFLASKGFNYVRILSMVSWDGLEIAPVTFTNRLGRVVQAWPDYWRQFRDLLELAGAQGLRVEVTIFADAQFVMPSKPARQSHLDGILANLATREPCVLHLEVANEAWQNGFPGSDGADELRAWTRYLAERTPVLVAITSPEDRSDRGITSLYHGSAAGLATVHFSRDTRTAEGGWFPVHDSYRTGRLSGVPPVTSNEPIGPGSSVGSESDPIKLCSAAAFAYLANLPGYVFHSRAGTYGYEKCCPHAGDELRFEGTAGIDAFRYLRDILPPDLANWTRNDGVEAAAPFTAFCNCVPDRFWPDVTGATNGCVRNIGSMNGSQFVALPMGILPGGIRLVARRAVRFEVFNPLTGAALTNMTLDAGEAFTLPQGPGAYLVKGSQVNPKVERRQAPLSDVPAVALSRSAGATGVDPFPPVSELPSHPDFPDPLVMFDGQRVTTREQWFNRRRPELMALFQQYMYGFLPPAPEDVSAKIDRDDRAALNGRATIKQVTLAFGPAPLPPMHLMLVIPNDRRDRAPVVLAMNYFGNHTLLRDPTVALATNWMPERGEGVVNNRATEKSRGTWVDIWQIEKTIARGYAVATFYNGDIDPDTPDQRGIQTYFSTRDAKYDCGTIAAWAWGLQRAVDYLVTDPDLDRSRILVTGHSRLGKAALLAAAFDDRIALAIPHQAGCGGSAPSRTALTTRTTASSTTLRKPETVKQINDAFPHWFNARFKEFNDRPDRLPFDQHCLVALCAPRPVLFSNGRQDTWINPEGQFEVLRAAAPVYRLLQAGDFAATEIPSDGRLIASKLGYFIRPGGHSLAPEDWTAFLDFADVHLGRPAKPDARSPARAAGATAYADARVGRTTAVTVARWELHEFVLRGRTNSLNPFDDAVVVGEFRAPSGRTNRVEGFYDGDNTWRLRFAPDEEGDWHFRLESKAFGISDEGQLQCTPPRGHGFIRVHPRNPYAFAYTDGTPYFPMGDTCYGLYDDSHITPALRREYLETRRRQRFNFVRMSVGHSEARAAADPAFWAWGGTPEKPDLDRLNPVFFRGLDELFRELQARGMNIELILLNFYRPPFTDPSLWTSDRERLWLRYLIARYAAFNHVFLWTLANEYETHPDGRYRLDRPGDLDWAKATARLVKDLDPRHHLVTVHPVISASAQGVSPRDPFDPPWRIGEFFGESDAIDVLSQQTGQSGAGVVWNEQLQCWVGDDANLVASVRADRRYRKPVLNTENGYEYLCGHPTERKQVHHTDKVRRSAWRIACAGGYFAAGFNGTIGHSDAWNRIDAPNRYTFTVSDEGAAAQLADLHDFFVALPFDRLEPFTALSGDAVAMAEPGSIYLIYLPRGGTVSVDLTAASETLTARWFNPRTGGFEEEFRAPQTSQANFKAPNAEDWVLLIRKQAGEMRHVGVSK